MLEKDIVALFQGLKMHHNSSSNALSVSSSDRKLTLIYLIILKLKNEGNYCRSPFFSHLFILIFKVQ